MSTLNAALFEKLSALPPPVPEYAERLLDSLLDLGHDAAIRRLAWHKETPPDVAAQLLELAAPSALLLEFRRLVREENRCARWPEWRQGSRLARAHEAIRQRAAGLFPGYLERRAARLVNAFTRTKAREAGFFRRIMPALSVEFFDEVIGDDQQDALALALAGTDFVKVLDKQ